MSRDPQNKLFQTNNYSIISKYSCVRCGYQRDDVLKTFMDDWLKVRSWKRTPLINRGYAARMMTIDWLVNRSIRFERVDCFVILGAGFDFLPFRLGDYSKHCIWIELDLPEVISAKSEFIRSKMILEDCDKLVQSGDGIHSSISSKYHLVECDMRNSQMLSSCLERIFSSLPTKPKNVAILNEVCLCYIDVQENKRILSSVIEAVRHFALRVCYIGYEQYKPYAQSPFNDVMSEHFSSMSYPLKHFPTSEELRQLFLKDLNFNHLTVTPVFQIYNTILTNQRQEDAHRNQPFDEYEELSLYLSHYALVTGVLVLQDPFDGSTKSANLKSDQLAEEMERMTLENTKGSISFVPSELERYGHASCVMEATDDGSYSIFVSGGFGRSLGKKSVAHARLSDCVVIKNNRDSANRLQLIGTENINPNLIRLDRMHGQIAHLGANKLFFNGGRQNPNKRDPLNAPFTARLIGDDELELIYAFQQTNEFARWRHKLCPYRNVDNRFMQVGGLGTSGYADPIILWNLQADKLGASIVRCINIDLFRRHSFAMDAADGVMFLMGGLKTTSELDKDRPVDMDANTILWDTRQGSPQKMQYDCGDCYGSSVHFMNDYQLVKFGGISSKTGLAENTVQLLDLRNKQHTPIAEDLLPLADQRMILTNASVCHSKSTGEIITTGGGGNYFTFGTRFNKSNLVYRYAQL